MDLTLAETATALGKSERQIRYLIKTERLEAVKVEGRWRVKSDDLPLTESQTAALDSRLAAARKAVGQGLQPAAKATAERQSQRQYSVTDLIVFESGVALHADMEEALTAEAAPCRRLAAALDLVARGCHCFQPRDKAKRFGAARDLMASAVAALHLSAGGDRERRRALAERIEQELIPKIAQLVARQEKRSRSARFEPFGSLAARGSR